MFQVGEDSDIRNFGLGQTGRNPRDLRFGRRIFDNDPRHVLVASQSQKRDQTEGRKTKGCKIRRRARKFRNGTSRLKGFLRLSRRAFAKNVFVSRNRRPDCSATDLNFF